MDKYAGQKWVKVLDCSCFFTSSEGRRVDTWSANISFLSAAVGKRQWPCRLLCP